MRLTTPRIAPAPAETWTDEQREIVEPMLARGSVLNIFRTLLTHPAAARAFLVWGGYILSRKSTLASREREIIILRTGFLCRCGYEWTQHVPIGRRAGLTDEEMELPLDMMCAPLTETVASSLFVALTTSCTEPRESRSTSTLPMTLIFPG